MIKMSAGTANVLRFRKLAIDVLPTTAYLMSGERCVHGCGFCPQARHASSPANLLSRVTWSEAGSEEIFSRLGHSYIEGRLKRACLQVVEGCDTLIQVKETVRELKQYSDIPVCVSTRVQTPEDILELADSGVDRVGIALDAASERVYNATKTGSWKKTMELIKEGAVRLPGRISTHLIVGLGETEQEMVNMMQHMWDLGVTVGLFAFTPVPGTRMASVNPPEIGHYRRIQAANYLLWRRSIATSTCTFRSGRLVHYGISISELKELLNDGTAFQTSGCPDCNRPYYNEKPGGIIYNYPRGLTHDEITEAIDIIISSLETGEDEMNG